MKWQAQPAELRLDAFCTMEETKDSVQELIGLRGGVSELSQQTEARQIYFPVWLVLLLIQIYQLFLCLYLFVECPVLGFSTIRQAYRSQAGPTGGFPCQLYQTDPWSVIQLLQLHAGLLLLDSHPMPMYW